jgi:signal transduction histidine kinase
MVAIERVRRQRYGVILLDLSMPRMGGYEVLRQVDGLDPWVRFIIITADQDADRRIETVRERISACLSKPFLIPQLLRSVAAAYEDYARREPVAAPDSMPTLPVVAITPSNGDVSWSAVGLDADLGAPPSAARLLLGAVQRARNPLTGIQAAAEILQAQLVAADSRSRQVKRIMQDALRLERLLQSFAMVLEPVGAAERPQAVAPLLRSAVKVVEGEACDGHCRVSLDLPPDLPSVPLRFEQMRWAFAELIRNAMAAIEGQEGLVELSARWLRAEAKLAIDVVDNGHGIDAAQLQRLLGRPMEWDPCLGLRIVNWVVASHGGTLHLRGRPGLGSMVTVELPVAHSLAEQAGGY